MDTGPPQCPVCAQSCSFLAQIFLLYSKGATAHFLRAFGDDLMKTEFFNTEMLRRTGEWQRAILDSANFTIISTDLSGVILTLNAGALKRLGYAREELIGKREMTILHDPAEIAERAEALSRELGEPVAAGFDVFAVRPRLGCADEHEWTYIRKDGTRYPVELSMTAVYDRSGTLTGFAGIGSDITERKRAEAEQTKLISELKEALDRVKVLRGLLPICSSCKSIRNDNGYWQRIEGYLKEHSEAEFSHSVCPQCMTILYPDYCDKGLPPASKSPKAPKS
jgi:PAS domain S-box-containing protein